METNGKLEHTYILILENNLNNLKMKTLKYIYTKNTLLFALTFMVFAGCERDISEDATFATFAKTPEIFMDAPIGMGSDFYFPYLGSKPTAWSVDEEVSYEGSASMRFDVPNDDDVEGNYAGAIFKVDGAGRNLTDYDALTFWAKASQGVSIGEFGFGEDFGENKYQATITNVSLGTNWTKYIIPIPDASLLVNERGMFRYAAGTQDTGGSAYTFWIDNLQFEKLGTIAQPQPKILNGENQFTQTVNGATIMLSGLTQTFNLASGLNQTIHVAPSYFAFTSSNPNIASVDEFGVITVLATGNTVITATLGTIDAAGSLTLESLGEFDFAPTPTLDPSLVISIFSDAYTNVPVDFYNGYWQPYQTTESADFLINGDNVLNYTNFNFVGTSFSSPTVDATEMTNMHFDIFIPGAIDPGAQLRITLRDFGNDQVDGGGDDTDLVTTFTTSTLAGNTWNSINIPLSLANKNNMGLIIYENLGSNLTNFYVDNIYFYEVPTTPTAAAPTPTLPASNVLSVFSDAYTNVDSNLNPNWGQSTVVSQELIEGNNTLKYANLNYQGLQLNAAQDVSTMTHLHIDYYSANSTNLNAYLISSGPVETAKSLAVPTTAGWVSIEIPLDDFSPVNLADIIQFKFDGNGDIYLDNIYFHN